MKEENIDSLDPEECALLEKTKLDLELKISEKTLGILFRSKAQWQCEGERNTKYFYNLERKRAAAKVSTSNF